MGASTHLDAICLVGFLERSLRVHVDSDHTEKPILAVLVVLVVLVIRVVLLWCPGHVIIHAHWCPLRGIAIGASSCMLREVYMASIP